MTNMKYDFDKVTPRRGTNSYKWDSTDDKEVLPMWVADMDFPIGGLMMEQYINGKLSPSVRL